MKFETEDIYNVLTRLVGEISPVGETWEDERRFENLKLMTELINKLLCDVDSVASFKDRSEYSMKRAGQYADEFFDEIGVQK